MIYTVKIRYLTLESTIRQTVEQTQNFQAKRTKKIFSLENSTRDLDDETILYQGILLPCKKDQGLCDPTTRVQATIVWFPEDTSTIFQFAKIHARMIKFHKYYFIESILFDKIIPEEIRWKPHQYTIIDGIEKKLTRFQIYSETEWACKYPKQHFRAQNSETPFKYHKGLDMKTGKLILVMTHPKKYREDDNLISR